MNLDRRFLLALTVMAIAVLACQAILPTNNVSNPEVQSPKEEVLFSDDFSDSNSGWDDIEDTDGITGYRDGGYRILINKTEWYFWSTPGINFNDAVITVDATKTGGPDNNEFGIICRYKDENNFYIFSISSDGYYGISKFIDGKQSGIGIDDMQTDTNKVIKLGNATNKLRATCNSDKLKLEVNGKVLADYQDTSLIDGDVGLIASTFKEAGVDILFDNFLVTMP